MTMKLYPVIRARGRDRTCVGFLLGTSKGWRAYDKNCVSLGMFDNEDAATRAVFENAEAVASATATSGTRIAWSLA